MSIFVEDPVPSRRGNRLGVMLTIGLLTAFAGGVVLFVLVIAPGIGAAGGCGGG